MDDEKDTAVQKAERKRMESIWWAVVLIWIGLVLGAEFLDILPEIGDSGEWWPWIFIGIGPWTLGLNLYQQTSVSLPNPSTWDWIWTAIFMLVALGTVVDIGGEIVGPVVLVVVGVIFLFRALQRSE